MQITTINIDSEVNLGPKAEECRMHTLAKSVTAHVQHCPHCSCIALHVGPLTLRLDVNAARSLWNTLGQALVRLELDLADELPRRSVVKAQGVH